MANLLHDGTEGEITNPLYVIVSDGSGGTGTVDTQLQASTTHIGNVTIDGADTLYADTITLSTVAAAIGTSQVCDEVTLQSSIVNNVDILVGNATLQPFRMVAGQSLTIKISNVATIYAKSVTGTAILNWLAT